MSLLDFLRSAGVSLRVEAFDSPRGLGRSWFVVDGNGDAVEVFSSRCAAEAAMRGERPEAAEPLAF